MDRNMYNGLGIQWKKPKAHKVPRPVVLEQAKALGLCVLCGAPKRGTRLAQAGVRSCTCVMNQPAAPKARRLPPFTWVKLTPQQVCIATHSGVRVVASAATLAKWGLV